MTFRPRVSLPWADLLAEAPVLDLRKEVLDDREVDVRFEQRHADVAQSLVDVVFGKLANTAETVGGRLEAFGDVLEQASISDGPRAWGPEGR